MSEAERMPARHPLVHLITMTVALFGGLPVGLWLGTSATTWDHPVADLVIAASVLALPGGLFAGFWLWLGAALVAMMASVVRGKGVRSVPDTAGTWVLVPAHAVPLSVVGLVAAWLPGGWGPFVTLAAYLGVGLVWGLGVGWLARRGLLIPPEPV